MTFCRELVATSSIFRHFCAICEMVDEKPYPENTNGWHEGNADLLSVSNWDLHVSGF